MNNEELQVINSSLNNINGIQIFDHIITKLKNSTMSVNRGENVKEKNFIQEVDERVLKLENIKNILKGDSFYLENLEKLKNEGLMNMRNRSITKSKTKTKSK